MDDFANAVGRTACAIVESFVYQCQTGQSVAAIGYGTIVLIVAIAALLVANRRVGR